jgi:hypothetical protein
MDNLIRIISQPKLHALSSSSVSAIINIIRFASVLLDIAVRDVDWFYRLHKPPTNNLPIRPTQQHINNEENDDVRAKNQKMKSVESQHAYDNVHNPNTFISIYGEYTFRDFTLTSSGGSTYLHNLHESLDLWVFLIPPSSRHYDIFKVWRDDMHQRKSVHFLADAVDDCFKVELVAHTSLLIPPGWIYSLYVPEHIHHHNADKRSMDFPNDSTSAVRVRLASVFVSAHFLHGYNLKGQTEALIFEDSLAFNQHNRHNYQGTTIIYIYKYILVDFVSRTWWRHVIRNIGYLYLNICHAYIVL